MELLSFNNETLINKLTNAEFNQICRSCLSVEGEMISIFSEDKFSNNAEYRNISDAQIYKMINFCSQVMISEEDGLPTQVCMKCALQASMAFNFGHQTQRADEILRQFLNIPLVKDDSEIMRFSSEANESEALEEDNEEIIGDDGGEFHTEMKYEEVGRSDQCAVNTDINETTPQYEKNYTENQLHFDRKSLKRVAKIKVKTKTKQTRHNRSSTKKLISSKPETHPTETEHVHRNENNDDTFETELKHDVAHDHYLIKSENEDEQEEDIDLKQLRKQLRDKKSKRDEDGGEKSRDKNDLYENPNDPQKCSLCGEVFSNVNKLVKHRGLEHGSKKFQCLNCGNGFTTTRGLRIHLRLHTGEKPEICSTCGKAFSDPRTLKSHERIHTGDQPFPCELCGKRFPARLPLEYHMRSHTGERPHKCDMCGKSYIQANSLQIHMRTHTGEKPYICKICYKAFTNGTSLSLHQLTHNGVKNFQCTVCGKRMARSGELTVHLRTHTGEKPFPCNHCNKAFTNSSALRAHMPTHTGIKNYVCSVCGKRVARAMELQIHMRTHTGEKNFNCSFCDKRFSTSSNLRLHERKHTGEKPYVCLICNRAFADSHVLKNHSRTHTGERPFICAICGHAFAQQTSLKTHIKSHKSEGRIAARRILVDGSIHLTEHREEVLQADESILVLPSDLTIDNITPQDVRRLEEINAQNALRTMASLETPIQNNLRTALLLDTSQNTQTSLSSLETINVINSNSIDSNNTNSNTLRTLDAITNNTIRNSLSGIDTHNALRGLIVTESVQNGSRFVPGESRTVTFDTRNNAFDPRRMANFFTYSFQQQ